MKKVIFMLCVATILSYSLAISYENMWHCPKCGDSHYTDWGYITTDMLWQPTYKDGEIVNGNPNIITYNRQCLGCNTMFIIRCSWDFYEIEEVDPAFIEIYDGGDTLILEAIKVEADTIILKTDTVTEEGK